MGRSVTARYQAVVVIPFVQPLVPLVACRAPTKTSRYRRSLPNYRSSRDTTPDIEVQSKGQPLSLKRQREWPSGLIEELHRAGRRPTVSTEENELRGIASAGNQMCKVHLV